jgi:hypothetical protein
MAAPFALWTCAGLGETLSAMMQGVNVHANGNVHFAKPKGIP